MTLQQNAPIVLLESKKAGSLYQLFLHAKISLHNFDKKKTKTISRNFVKILPGKKAFGSINIDFIHTQSVLFGLFFTSLKYDYIQM